MGMTDDFEVAVEEGATIVRVGRALFGERPHGRQPSAEPGDGVHRGPVTIAGRLGRVGVFLGTSPVPPDRAVAARPRPGADVVGRPGRRSQLRAFVVLATEPILGPGPPGAAAAGTLDLSPFVVLIVLGFLCACLSPGRPRRPLRRPTDTRVRGPTMSMASSTGCSGRACGAGRRRRREQVAAPAAGRRARHRRGATSGSWPAPEPPEAGRRRRLDPRPIVARWPGLRV